MKKLFNQFRKWAQSTEASAFYYRTEATQFADQRDRTRLRARATLLKP